MSAVLLAWQLRISVPAQRRAHSEDKSARAFILPGLEGLLLLVALTETSDHSRVSTAFLSYLAALFLFRQMPPPGREHARHAASQHSLFLYAMFWITKMATLDGGVKVTVLASCLLVTALVSPRILPQGYDASLDPTGESRSSILGIVSSAWLDTMLLKAWITGALKPQDVPALSSADAAVLNATRYKRASPSLLINLLRRFGLDLSFQALLASLSGVFTFVPTLLLGSIPQYVEGTKPASVRQAQLYVVLLFLTSIVASAAENQALWIGQKTGLRLTTILINEVYEKALRRPIAPRSSEGHPAGQGQSQRGSNADTGTIMNIFMANITIIVDLGSNTHQIWASVPVQIVMAIGLLFLTLGYSGFAGVALMAAMVPLNSRISRRFGAIQMQSLSYLPGGSLFRRQIDDKRATELRVLRSRYLLWSTAATIWYGMPLLITFSSFFVYAVVEGKPLTPSLAFTSLSLFSLLKTPLDDFVGILSRVQSCLVSLRRVEDFLAEEETGKHLVLQNATASDGIDFEDATFAWPGKQGPAAGSDGFTLKDLNLNFKVGEPNVVLGRTGCGKTSMLLALLEELPLVNGTVRMPPAIGRGTLSADASTGLVNGVAFCAQEAWLIDDTLSTKGATRLFLMPVHFAGALAGITILIVSITPAFLFPGALISAAYYLIAVVYMTASRDLKDMESNRRTPLVQHLGETLSGIVTIRAYGAEGEYSAMGLSLLDKSSQPSFFLASTERWLAFRLSLTGAFVSLFAGIFAITSAGKLSAGAIGLSMSYAISFSEHVLWLIRYYMSNSQNMTALKRIQDYMDLTQEEQEATDGTIPSEDWPASGVVQYDGVSARYAQHLEYVLRDVSFTIKPREKIGIVGRTGAGKSSLALTLLRSLEIEAGRIVFDGVNTRDVDLPELRRRLAYVPQDSTLFAGTLRFNLDPLEEHIDEEVLNAVSRVGLVGSRSEDENTTSGVHSGKFGDLCFALSNAGPNISQGQRQLVCIARAVLKGSSIIILDEATASIDHESDLKMRVCVRDVPATVITSAHRLRTVIDYDRIISLDAGHVGECDHPWQLLQRQSGIFKGMCEAAVDYEELAVLAKTACEAR
ncbi:hypothetical protein QQX98_009261 [Neonectria punicea]|uniref:Uncharacterized protein n=1 Tax=Neonectria punicea TaxID=979145 RepID=A0ABR1GSS0_9HYPO